MSITTVLPPAPVTNSPAFDALADAYFPALNDFNEELIGYVPTINAAIPAASAAVAAANYKGLWSSLTGALAIPASVSHGGKLWLLTASVANVTAHTPGVSANWQEIGKALTPTSTLTQVLTTDLTLTSASAQALRLSSSVVGCCVRLPSANTLSVGTQYIISNTSALPFGVRNSSSLQLLTGINGSGLATLTLLDNSTADGAWGITGSNLSPGLITADTTLSTTFSSRPIHAYASLSDNLSIHFAAIAASGFAAFAVNSLGRTITTPITVDAGVGCTVHCAFRVSATEAIVFYVQNTNYRAVVLTWTGAAITVGTIATAAAAWFTDPAAENQISTPKIIALTPTLYYIHGGQTDFWSTAVSVSAGVCTIGTRLATATVGTTKSELASCAYTVSATTALVLTLENISLTPQLWARVISVSGVTCTAGAGVNIWSEGISSAPPSCQLTPTKILVGGADYTTSTRCNVLTVTGTSISVGATFTVEAITDSIARLQGFGSVDQPVSRYARSLTTLTGTTALFTYSTTGGLNSRAVVLVESGGTLTAPGGVLHGSWSNEVSPNPGYGGHFPVGAQEFVAMQVAAIAAGFSTMLLNPHQINGTTITTGPGRLLYEAGLTTSNFRLGVKIGDRYVLLASSASASVSHPAIVFRCKDAAIDFMGTLNLPTPGNGNSNLATGWGYPNLGNGTLWQVRRNAQVGTATQLRITRMEVAL